MPTGGTGGSGTGPSGTAFGRWDPGGCNCPPQPILVEGCDAVPYPGVTVSVYSASGGTLLFSATTDSAGKVYPTTVLPGTWYVTVTGQNARYASYGQNLTLSTTGVAIATLSPAAGYSCLGLGCLLPTLPNLNYTGPAGAQVLTGGGGIWNGPGQAVTLNTSAGSGAGAATIFYSGSGTRVYGSSLACPPGLSITFTDGSTVTE